MTNTGVGLYRLSLKTTDVLTHIRCNYGVGLTQVELITTLIWVEPIQYFSYYFPSSSSLPCSVPFLPLNLPVSLRSLANNKLNNKLRGRFHNCRSMAYFKQY